MAKEKPTASPMKATDHVVEGPAKLPSHTENERLARLAKAKAKRRAATKRGNKSRARNRQ